MTDRTDTIKAIPQERIERIKKLIFYVCAHRVKTYYGTLDNFTKQTATLKRWRRYSKDQKNAYKKSWGTIAAERRRFNACLSIPSGLVKDILGYSRDENGKLFRFSSTQMVKQLGGFLKCTYKHGHKFGRDASGKCSVDYSYGTKYILNEKLFYKLWNDEDMHCYFSIETLGDKRLQDLIAKHFKKNEKSKENEKMDYQVYATNIPPQEDDLEYGEQQPQEKAAEKPQEKPVGKEGMLYTERIKEYATKLHARGRLKKLEAELVFALYGLGQPKTPPGGWPSYQNEWEWNANVHACRLALLSSVLDDANRDVRLSDKQRKFLENAVGGCRERLARDRRTA